MKAVMILAIALIGGNSIVYAGNGEKAFKKMLERKIFYPLSVQSQNDVSVTVSVCVSEVGELFISSVVSENQEMNDAIRKQFEKLSVKVTPDMYGKTYQYKFKLVQE
jgi:hypothetical protein